MERRPRLLAIAAGVLALAAVATGCGTSPSPLAGPSATSSAAAPPAGSPTGATTAAPAAADAAERTGGGTTPTPTLTPAQADRAYDEWGAWAVGRRISVGDGVAEVERRPDALVATSAGAVALTDSPPFRAELIRPTGERRRLTADPDGAPVGADLAHPRIAWLTPGDGEVVLHVWDVERDRSLATRTLSAPDQRADSMAGPSSGPPLDGDLAYVTTPAGTIGVDWRTGRTRRIDGSVVAARAGLVEVATDTSHVEVRDTRAADRLLQRVRARTSGGGQAGISPDGAWVAVQGPGSGPVRVVSLRNGELHVVPELVGTLAWTRSGHLVGHRDGARLEDGVLQDGVGRCTVADACDLRAVTGLDATTDLLLAAAPPVG